MNLAPRVLRKHQLEMERRARAIALGTILLNAAKKTLAQVTPGGGKSLAYAIFAGVLLDAGLIDGVCVVVPRLNLQKQIVKQFHCPPYNKYWLMEASNRFPFLRNVDKGVRGYVVTYQGVAANPEAHLAQFREGRWLLILDECHHLAEGEHREWVKALEPLVNVAKFCLFGSGTIERWDGNKIPFIDYETRSDGLEYPKANIRYTRRDAIAEGAINPLEVKFHDGTTEFETGGCIRQIQISNATPDIESKVLATLLSEYRFREQLIEQAISHWRGYRSMYKHTKAQGIFVCKDQDMARDVAAEVEARHTDLKIRRAISDDGAEATRVIDAFREKHDGDFLVTVGMAYEGLDVEDITHVIVLTDVRSHPWLSQCLARANRISASAPKGIQQWGYVFAPADPRMRECIERIRLEQEEGLREKNHTASVGAGGVRGPSQSFTPLDAIHTNTTHEPLDPDSEGMHPGDDYLIGSMLSSMPGMSRQDAVSFIKRVRDSQAAPVAAHAADVNPNDEEARVRDRVNKLANKAAEAVGLGYKEYNKRLFAKFKKSRKGMGIAELLREEKQILADIKRAQNNSNGSAVK